ncbi:hypothetical protein GCM10023115_20790 [Pontixanthobacter gangjinensis]|uniref:Tetratricopeptide repeat protein n=1 Tax=Pontixanthobacter gangjinensis TaxID=1028742 RepID=A0A6I4SR30_9SPHN|nr:tetratricopeptide repeat protein [Pontixanthobacter gangjinensis]MXO57327.1 tetratricopeptide repeat protein [Pontixanthobacter gangjinensis]
MSWIPLIALGVTAFLIAAFVLKLPKSAWSIFGAAMLFGLAGYALQGNPGYSGAPKTTDPVEGESNFAMIEARREFFDPDMMPSRFVVTADAFSRNGKHQDAANMLRNAVTEKPDDAEAWLALGNALIEHADGTLTPAAMYSYSRAEKLNPLNPAPTYFLGVAFLRSGQPGQARGVWADLLENAPDDAAWRPQLEERLGRLDELLGQTGGLTD